MEAERFAKIEAARIAAEEAREAEQRRVKEEAEMVRALHSARDDAARRTREQAEARRKLAARRARRGGVGAVLNKAAVAERAASRAAAELRQVMT